MRARCGVGPARSKKYLLAAACTELYTHYLPGGRNLDTFKGMAIVDLAAGSVIVHDRYQNCDADPFAPAAPALRQSPPT